MANYQRLTMLQTAQITKPDLTK